MRKLPSREELELLVQEVKGYIRPDRRAFVDDDEPGICLTVGWSPDNGKWGWQTGDNSYSGGAYSYPVWAVVSLYADTDVTAAVDEILEELEDYTDSD